MNFQWIRHREDENTHDEDDELADLLDSADDDDDLMGSADDDELADLLDSADDDDDLMGSADDDEVPAWIKNLQDENTHDEVADNLMNSDSAHDDWSDQDWINLQESVQTPERSPPCDFNSNEWTCEGTCSDSNDTCRWSNAEDQDEIISGDGWPRCGCGYLGQNDQIHPPTPSHNLYEENLSPSSVGVVERKEKEEIPPRTTRWDIQAPPRRVASKYSRRTKADHDAWLSSNTKVPTPKANDPPSEEHLWEVPIPNLCNRLGPNLSNILSLDPKILPTSGKTDCLFATMEFLGIWSVEEAQWRYANERKPNDYDVRNQLNQIYRNYHHTIHTVKWRMTDYQDEGQMEELYPDSVGEIELNLFFDMISPGYMTYASLGRPSGVGHAIILGKNKDGQPILIDRQKVDQYIIGMPKIVQYLYWQSITSLSYIMRRKTGRFHRRCAMKS